MGLSNIIDQSYVKGYISVKARIFGKNHIICLGYTLGRNRCNKYGIQIRGEDGMLDGRGNVAGHGTDPTGNVTDINALAKSTPFIKVFQDSDGIKWHECHEETRWLKVKGSLNNKDKGRVTFEFSNGIANDNVN